MKPSRLTAGAAALAVGFAITLIATTLVDDSGGGGGEDTVVAEAEPATSNDVAATTDAPEVADEEDTDDDPPVTTEPVASNAGDGECLDVLVASVDGAPVEFFPEDYTVEDGDFVDVATGERVAGQVFSVQVEGDALLDCDTLEPVVPDEVVANLPSPSFPCSAEARSALVALTADDVDAEGDTPTDVESFSTLVASQLAALGSTDIAVWFAQVRSSLDEFNSVCPPLVESTLTGDDEFSFCAAANVAADERLFDLLNRVVAPLMTECQYEPEGLI